MSIAQLSQRIAEVPPLDRWDALGKILDQLDRKICTGLTVEDQLELRDVEQLAEAAGLTTGTMVRRLREHGGLPFKNGKRWVIRAASLVTYYDNLEHAQNR